MKSVNWVNSRAFTDPHNPELVRLQKQVPLKLQVLSTDPTILDKVLLIILLTLALLIVDLIVSRLHTLGIDNSG
jgi:hypothetical protein